MNCERYTELIGELVDGTLDGADRHELDAHLMRCEACAGLADELLVVRRAARALPPLAPPEAAWVRLSTALSAVAPRRASAWRRVALPLAAAAALVLAIIAGLNLARGISPARTGEPASSAAGEAGASADLAGSVEAELRKAEFHFENAISGLDALAKQDRDALDPQVAAELQKNLTVIDRAIAESRAALRSQPLSEEAQESLFEAFRSKIALLQETISLINEMRKGNQAETARIADGIGKS